MTKENRRTLNLDDLFGVAREIVITINKKDYKLKQPESFDPTDWVKLQKLMKEAGGLEGLEEEDFTEDTSQQLERLYVKMIEFLSPSLAKVKMAFAARVRIVLFYTAQIEGDESTPDDELKKDQQPKKPEAKSP